MPARPRRDEEGRIAMTPERFCISEAITFARSLSYCDCLRFLQGFVLLAGESQETQPLREVIAELQQSDRQLELIAEGQLKLQLSAEPAPPQQVNGSNPNGRRGRNTKERKTEMQAFLLRHAEVTDANHLTSI